MTDRARAKRQASWLEVGLPQSLLLSVRNPRRHSSVHFVFITDKAVDTGSLADRRGRGKDAICGH